MTMAVRPTIEVLHVIPSLATRIGGPAFALVEACRELPRYGVATTVFTTDMAQPQSAKPRTRAMSGDLPPGADQLDVRIFRSGQPYRLAYSRSLSKALRSNISEFDIVHIHMLFHLPARAAYRAALRSGTPYVVSPSGSLDPVLRTRSRFVKAVNDAWWQREMLDRAALIHYKTSAEHNLCEDLELQAPSFVAPNGIKTDQSSDARLSEAFRARYLGSSSTGPVVMNVGRIAYKKGLDRLVTAFAGVVQAIPGARLVIVGPDDEHLQAGLEHLAHAKGITDAVVFTGLLTGDDRVAALSAADVWVLPSDTENFGNAVVEAMAAGVPVIVSEGVNISAEIVAADAGLISELDPTAIGRAILDLLTDDPKRKALGAGARTFAQRYAWATVGLVHRQMYETALGRTGAFGEARGRGSTVDQFPEKPASIRDLER